MGFLSPFLSVSLTCAQVFLLCVPPAKCFMHSLFLLATSLSLFTCHDVFILLLLHEKYNFRIFFPCYCHNVSVGFNSNIPSLKSSLFTKSHKLLIFFSTDDPRKQQHVYRGGAAVRPTCVGYQDPDRAFQWTCSHCLHAGGTCGISLAWWVNLTRCFLNMILIYTRLELLDTVARQVNWTCFSVNILTLSRG